MESQSPEETQILPSEELSKPQVQVQQKTGFLRGILDKLRHREKSDGNLGNTLTSHLNKMDSFLISERNHWKQRESESGASGGMGVVSTIHAAAFMEQSMNLAHLATQWLKEHLENPNNNPPSVNSNPEGTLPQ